MIDAQGEMSEQELESVAARCAVASAGPWSCPSDESGSGFVVLGPAPDVSPLVLVAHTLCTGAQHAFSTATAAANAQFIAAARQDVPLLLAEVRRLRSSSGARVLGEDPPVVPLV